MRVRYTPAALAELDEVLGYLAERSPQGARRVNAAIRAAELTLSEFPLIGTQTTARRRSVRRYALTPFPYALFYEVTGEDVRIAAVRHTARRPEP